MHKPLRDRFPTGRIPIRFYLRLKRPVLGLMGKPSKSTTQVDPGLRNHPEHILLGKPQIRESQIRGISSLTRQ